MRQLLVIVGLAAVALALVGAMGYGAVSTGTVTPPTGTVRLGPLTVMSLPPCPTITGAIIGAGRRCGSASPWSVWVVWRGPGGERYEWKVISMVLNGG
ncbi:MAG: hypothetical protein RLZZ387_5242 [Chloroflexota bacterium]|jgi:hypothetical protein